MTRSEAGQLRRYEAKSRQACRRGMRWLHTKYWKRWTTEARANWRWEMKIKKLEITKKP